MQDTALETLFFPFANGALRWPDAGALFLRARDGEPLHREPRPGLDCEQTFKPDADALRQRGFNLVDGDAGISKTYPLVLLLPPRQRDEARALMARAITAVAPGGYIVCSASNNEGARSSESDLSHLVGSVTTLVKNKCRVFWSAPLNNGSDAIDKQLQSSWLEFDAVRPIDDNRFVSRPGVFAWDRIDPASAALAKHFSSTLQGRAADLGAGFGYLSVELLTRCPGITALDVYEAEKRALDLARINISSASQTPANYLWHDVTAGLSQSYDVIVTNPPFHTGTREDRPDIGRRFITVAAAALSPGGRLLLVANRHLPYESVLTQAFGKVRTLAQEHGFKMIEAVRTR
jgi:16S rRNA (guanine1207-N2)-methyltransferase